MDKIENHKSKTKQDEIDALRTFAGQVGVGTYLDTLFSHDLLNWVQTAIEDDIAPDLFGTLQVAYKERDKVVLKVTAERDEALAQRDEAQGMAEGNALKLELADQTCDDLRRVNVDLRAELDEAYAETRRLNKTIEAIADVTVNAWIQEKHIVPEQIRALLND